MVRCSAVFNVPIKGSDANSDYGHMLQLQVNHVNAELIICD